MLRSHLALALLVCFSSFGCAESVAPLGPAAAGGGGGEGSTGITQNPPPKVPARDDSRGAGSSDLRHEHRIMRDLAYRGRADGVISCRQCR